MIKILVVDDHEIVRQGIMGLLSREREFEVVGEADNGLTAVALAKDLSPDVVLMDLTIPELNGIEATERIIETCHQTRVVVLTMHQDRAHIRRAFEAGASGYILKKNDLGDLIRAIHTVSRGEVFLSPAISRVVVETFVGREDLPIAGGKSDGLSHREREVACAGCRRGDQQRDRWHPSHCGENSGCSSGKRDAKTQLEKCS